MIVIDHSKNRTQAELLKEFTEKAPGPVTAIEVNGTTVYFSANQGGSIGPGLSVIVVK